MEHPVMKWGNSLAVRLPKQVAAEARFQQGDRIRLEWMKRARCESNVLFPTLDELVSQINA